jgi:hypothetical protein
MLRTVLRLVSCVVALSSLDMLAGAETSSLFASDGQWLQGMPSMSAGTLVVGSQSVALDRVINCEFPVNRLHWLDQGVILADGQVLRGVVREYQNEKLSFGSDLLGEQTFSTSAISAMVISPIEAGAPLQATAGIAGVVLANSEHIAGEISFINQLEIGITSGKRVRSVPRDRVRLVILHPCVPLSGVWIQLATGDRLHGTLSSITDNTATLVNSFGSLNLPMSQVCSLWSESPGLQPLERLACDETHVPTFDEVFPARLGELPLSGGVTGTVSSNDVRRGILAHVGTTLHWQNVSGYASLVGTIAGGPMVGTVNAIILVDGKPVFTSGPLSPGQPAKAFAVSVQGASQISFTVQHADPADCSSGGAVWSWPTLVK